MIAVEIPEDLRELCESASLPECEVLKEAMRDPVVGSLVGDRAKEILEMIRQRL